MFEKLVHDYWAYFKVDLAKELTPVQETIEDMLTRLEEFETLMAMVNSNASQTLDGPITEILSRKRELDELCENVDHLEALVRRVKKDVALIEMQVEAAESDLAPTENTFKSIFKPFFKKSDPLAPKSPKVYRPPEIFKTTDFFSPMSDSPGDESSN